MAKGRLVIPKTRARREYKDDPDCRQYVIDAWLEGIFTELPAKGVDGCRLLKGEITTDEGPRRLVFLLAVASGDTIFLLYRDKKDEIGENITYKNPKFENVINGAINQANLDIANKNAEIIPPPAEIPKPPAQSASKAAPPS